MERGYTAICPKRERTCRVCGGDIHPFLDLGLQPRADAFRSPSDRSPEITFDLAAGVCGSCNLVQLLDEVPPELMFNASYPFRTSTSNRMKNHFREAALSVLEANVIPATSPFIVEFGCNDGTFLTPFAEMGYDHLGIDPAANLVAEAVGKGINAQTGWFNVDMAKSILETKRHATVIYAANTLSHISDLASVLSGVNILLAKDGRFIFEDPYFGDIVRMCAFDQFYDEHIFYFTATSVDLIAKKFGLVLIDVKHLDTHGGQLRYTIARQPHEQSRAVLDLIEHERAIGLHSKQRLMEFAEAVHANKVKLLSTLKQLAVSGKTIAGYAATAKSATVLNFCGIGPEQLGVIYDTTPEKQGRLSPGSGIAIKPFPERVEDYPDIFLLFAWNHAGEIASREIEFRARGGTWLRFVPDVTLSQSPVA